MSIVKRKSSKTSDIQLLDSGITVKKALKLIEKSEFYNEIYEIFNIKEIENDFVEIKGADELVKAVITSDEECEKIDIDCKLSDISIAKFTESNQLLFDISNVIDPRILKTTKNDLIKAESIYSVKSEYLNTIYSIEKYLDFCRRNKYEDIIQQNLDMLKQKNKENNNSRKIRLLKASDDKFYARAITSVENYKDYNLRLSLFIALIELHRLIKYKSQDYYVNSYSVTDSDLKVIFKSNKKHKISNDIQIGFSLELINDEIRREAVKFNGIFSIYFAKAEIHVKPDVTKSAITSFTHGMGIEKVKERITGLSENIHHFITDTIDDAKTIKILDKPDLFREHILQKVHYSRNQEFNNLYKSQVKNLLSSKVNSIFELSEIFNKVDLLITDDHIDSQDFWRFKLYQVLLDNAKD